MHCPKHSGKPAGLGAHASHDSASHLVAVGSGIAASAAAASVTKKTGSGIMIKLTKNPFVVFGLGVAAGFLVHKYRKEIIGTASRAGEKGKDFVLQQKENLEDLVAEYKENEDDVGKTGKPGNN